MDRRKYETDRLGETIAGAPNDDSRGMGSTSGAASAPRNAAPDSTGGNGFGAARHVGRYRLERRLGAGAMGVVHLAWQDHPRRPVALKLMRADRFSPAMLRRFELEAQHLARLQHPGIARIYDAGTCDLGEGTIPFVAMEYIEGVSLSTWARAQNDHRTILAMIATIADAVEHAHRKGVIHRDLKPANILVDAEGTPRILDFGVSRAVDDDSLQQGRTMAGEFVGTLPYMSPEQVAGDPRDLDTRSDVYALGVIAYELLAGRLPIDLESSTLAHAVELVTSVDPPPLGQLVPALRGDVEVIVARALEKDPDRRYASASAFADDIRRCLNDEPILARPQSSLERLSRFTRRHRAAVVVGALACVAVAAFGVGLVVKMIEASDQRDRAVRAEQRAEEKRRLAEEEAATSRAVNEFLTTMLVSADPDRAMGEALTVRDVVDAAAAGIDVAFPDRPLVEAGVRSTLGATYRSLGLYAKAEEHLLAAVDLYDGSLGSTSSTAATARRAVSNVWIDQGRFDEAEALITQVIDALAADPATAEDPAELILARGELARINAELGRLNEAAQMLEELIEEAACVLGDDHPSTLSMRHNLATIMRISGDYEGAESLTRQVLEARRRILGDDHPQSLYSGNALAAILQRRGRSAEAEALFREMLEARARVLGDEHTSTMTVRQNLVTLLIEAKRLDEAEPLLTRVIDANRRTLGPAHPKTLMTLNMHAYLLEELGEIDAAETAYRASIAASDEVLGPASPEWYPPRNNLATLLQQQGRLDEAAELFELLVREAERNLPEGQLYRCVIDNNAGDCLRELGRLDEAEPLLVRSLNAFESAFGAEHPRTVKARNRLDALARARSVSEPSQAAR